MLFSGCKQIKQMNCADSRFWMYVVLLIFLCGSDKLAAQDNRVHSLSWRVSAPITGTAAAQIGTAGYLYARKDTLDLLSIDAHRIEDIPRIDRIATRHWSPASSTASDVLMIASIASPLLFLANEDTRKEGWTIAGMYAQTFLLTWGLTALTKEISQRSRPFVYNPEVPDYYKFRKDARSSFFSGHTSISAASVFFAATVYSGFYTERDWRWAGVWTLAAAVPLSAGILRVTAGKHFPTDIIIGYGVGATLGWLVPYLHRN